MWEVTDSKVDLIFWTKVKSLLSVRDMSSPRAGRGVLLQARNDFIISLHPSWSKRGLLSHRRFLNTLHAYRGGHPWVKSRLCSMLPGLGLNLALWLLQAWPVRNLTLGLLVIGACIASFLRMRTSSWLMYVLSLLPNRAPRRPHFHLCLPCWCLVSSLDFEASKSRVRDRF